MKWPVWTPWRTKASDDTAQQEIALPVSLSGMDYRSVPTAGSKVLGLDGVLMSVVAGLLLWGLVMVYSASIALPENPRFANYAPTHFVIRHGISLTVGLLGALLAFQLPMSFWQRAAPFVFAAALLLLVAVLIPGIGKGVNGARRWINLGVLNFQPSELAKVAVLLYASDYVVRRAELVKTSFWKSVWPMAMVVAIVGILLLAEPDMGALMVIAMIAVLIMVLGGVEARQSLLIFLVLGLTFALVIATSEWRRQRIFAYLDPWSEAHALGKGYQLTHSLIALGRGQIFGVGLGGSVEKLHWLPEAHTDFLLAVIGEEFGFLGVLALIGLFYWLTRRLMLIGRTAVALGRPFSGWVAQGVGIWIGGQALINIGVNVGALPTKGLTLPLMSYGGSAVLMNLIAIAIVLRVDMENKRLMRGERVE